eukprot:5508538-Pyramimonas_sp.AAC.1
MINCAWRGHTNADSKRLKRADSSSSPTAGTLATSAGARRSAPSPVLQFVRLAAARTSAPVIGGRGSSRAAARAASTASRSWVGSRGQTELHWTPR